MHLWSWAPLACLGAILISSLQVLQTESATIGQLLALWSITTPKASQPGKPATSDSGSKPATVDYSFKGTTHDRTESSLYPTTPRADLEFKKWEEQEEAKYAQRVLLAILASGKTPLDPDTLTSSVQSKEEAGLQERQETDNEKTVSSFFGNQSPPKKREPLFPNFNFPTFSETFGMGNRMSPVINSFRQYFGTGSTSGSLALSESNSTAKNESSTHSPLMKIISSIRIPTMTPDGGAKFNAQMQKWRENWNQRNVLGTLNETLQIASPILTDQVPLTSAILGIVDFVRCNTVGRFSC